MSMSGRSRTPRSSSYLESWHEPPRRLDAGRVVMLVVLAAAYLGFGLLHILRPEGFMAIVPPALPSPREIVIGTGVYEVLGAIGLLLRPTRRYAAVMLALYAVCVWPANFHHAFAGVHVNGIPDSWWYHGPRLALQPVIAWWPLYASGMVNWPFSKGRHSRA